MYFGLYHCTPLPKKGNQLARSELSHQNKSRESSIHCRGGNISKIIKYQYTKMKNLGSIYGLLSEIYHSYEQVMYNILGGTSPIHCTCRWF